MRRNFQIAIGLLWLAPVVVVLQYWRVWNRLPQSVATHFAANGQPNGAEPQRLIHDLDELTKAGR